MKRKLPLAAGCFVCVVIGVKSLLTFEGTEFGGGTLFRHQDMAVNLLVLALILTIRFPRVASAAAFVGAFVSIPVYLYLTFPRPFEHAWGGEWSVVAWESLVWNPWWALGLLGSAFVIFLSAIQIFQAIRSAVRLMHQSGA